MSPADQVAPALSVLVPTYNRRDALGRLLASLAGQTLPPSDFEVVVVDDGSTDGTADRLRARRDRARPPPVAPLTARRGGVGNAWYALRG